MWKTLCREEQPFLNPAGVRGKRDICPRAPLAHSVITQHSHSHPSSCCLSSRCSRETSTMILTVRMSSTPQSTPGTSASSRGRGTAGSPCGRSCWAAQRRTDAELRQASQLSTHLPVPPQKKLRKACRKLSGFFMNKCSFYGRPLAVFRKEV